MSKQVVLAGFHAVNARVRLKPESVKVVYVDAQRRDKRMHECCARLNKSGIKVVQADARRLDGLAPDLPHQGVVALADEIVNTLTFDELLDSITDKTLLLILDGVTDPRNFGACLRVADAAGVQAVVAPKDRSASFSPAAAKAAAGAWETVPVVSVTNLAASIVELREAGVLVVGTAGEAEKSIYDFDPRSAPLPGCSAPKARGSDSSPARGAMSLRKSRCWGPWKVSTSRWQAASACLRPCGRERRQNNARA